MATSQSFNKLNIKIVTNDMISGEIPQVATNNGDLVLITDAQMEMQDINGLQGALADKQDKLTAGAGITIDENTNTINVTGGGTGNLTSVLINDTTVVGNNIKADGVYSDTDNKLALVSSVTSRTVNLYGVGNNYTVGDQVIYSNKLYICVTEHTSADPYAPGNEDYWVTPGQGSTDYNVDGTTIKTTVDGDDNVLTVNYGKGLTIDTTAGTYNLAANIDQNTLKFNGNVIYVDTTVIEKTIYKPDNKTLSTTIIGTTVTFAVKYDTNGGLDTTDDGLAVDITELAVATTSAKGLMSAADKTKLDALDSIIMFVTDYTAQ